MKKYIQYLLTFAYLFSATTAIAITTAQPKSGLNWIEISKADLSTQVMLDFTTPIYFETQINEGKSQVIVSFKNIDTQTTLKDEIKSALEEQTQGDIIDKISFKGNALIITLAKKYAPTKTSKTAPLEAVFKFDQIEKPCRLIINIYPKAALDEIKDQNTTMFYAQNNNLQKNTPFFFGKKRSLNRPLRVVLDAGHGGKDTGAINLETGIKEKDLTLQIAKNVRSRLIQNGIHVLLTRPSDKDDDVSLKVRSELAEQFQADLFVSIHLNATEEPTTTLTGIETYHSNHDEIYKNSQFLFFNMPKKASEIKKLTHFFNNTAKASEQLASSMQTSLLNNLRHNGFNPNDRGVKKGMYRLLMRNSMPSVLIELEFITNLKNAILLSNRRYQDCLAQGIATGVIKTLGLKTKTPQEKMASLRK